jgi:hypothetical protein
MNKARVKKLVFALAGFLIVIQFVQPKRTNPPVVPSKALAARVRIPDDVQSILMRACSDCHTNQTVWPWYSHVAPISWVIVDDVNQGRRHMNFQDWDARAPKQPYAPPLDICREVRESGMPPVSYRIMHSSGQLTPQEISAVCSWFQSLGTTWDRGPETGP